MAVIIMDYEQKFKFPLICNNSELLSELEEKLYEKQPKCKDENHKFYLNNQELDISKTIKENNITKDCIIYYKKIEEEPISVIIEPTDQSFLYPFICKKTDKFTELEKKLYKKLPDLKNKQHYYITRGNLIDINKTIKENEIEDGQLIVFNYAEF